MKRENAGSWNSGLEKEQILETYSVQLQESWNFTKIIFGINKKYWAKKLPKEDHPPSTSVGGARYPPGRAHLPRGPPGRPPVPLFCYMRSFTLKKIRSKLSGRNSAATRRNLGGTNLGLRWSCSAGKLPSRRGKSSPSSSPTILSSGGGQSPSTSSPAPSPLKPKFISYIYPLSQSLRLVPVGC